MVRNGSWDPPGGPGCVGAPFRRSGTGYGILPEVLDGSGNLLEVLDGSGDPPLGPGRIWGLRDCLKRVRGPSQGSGTCPRTLEEVWDGFKNSLRGPGWVGGPSQRSGTGRGTLPEVWDESGDPWGAQGWIKGHSRRSGTVWETLPKV